ncbi:hypothetical protein AB1L30_10895 [Bremerella sp. JC817]|uniref:hypothetical protein n=1 Tax=Bremerella sp. JC817 TaxID=3231756 RepID=UPI003458648E
MFSFFRHQKQAPTLEQQLETLQKLGIGLAEGIKVDDLLISFDQASFEAEPYSLLLFVLGIEVEERPFGRRISQDVWNFDTECITGTGSYVPIVQNLASLAGQGERITEIEDFVDLEEGQAWLKYCLDGQPLTWDVEVNDDWADPMVVNYVMGDLEKPNQHFYALDNGQSAILLFLEDGITKELGKILPEPLMRAIPEY